MKVALERLKSSDAGKQWAIARKHRIVRIWSNEWKAWWRPDACGYTVHIEAAGLYCLERALENSSGCDPSKGIVYEFVKGG